MANKPIPWTENEIALLKEKYPISTKKELLELFPDRSSKSISGKAEKMGIKKVGELERKNWTEEELDLIKVYYANSSKGEMLKLLPNRTWNEIQHKSSRLNIRKYKEYREPRHSWSEEEIKQIVLDRGYVYHGTYFDSFNKRKIVVECSFGIKQDVFFDSFKNGSEAGSLNITRRKTFQEAVEAIEKEGYMVVSDERSYVNSKSSIETICPNGHLYLTNFANFNHGNRCQDCWLQEIGKSNVLPIDVVKDRFIQDGFTIVEDIDIYEGSKQQVKCKCIHHLNEEALPLSYSQVVHYKIKCAYCVRDERMKSYQEKYNTIDNFFKENNLIFKLTIGEYIENRLKINSEFDLVFICNEHSYHGEQTIMDRSFRFNNNPCRFCAKKKISGNNSPHWNGGTSNLSEYLRGKINKWKFDSLKSNNFRCVLTGAERDLIVHHVKPFSEIVRETMKELCLPIHANISKYTDKELEIISSHCIAKHYEGGMGVPLHKDVHDLFHEEYSVFHFNEEDFYEFVNRFRKGEFNSYTKEVVGNGS